MKHARRFKHPGPIPKAPPAGHPLAHIVAGGAAAEHARAVRLHEVAVAVDALAEAREQRDLTAAETIALAVGLDYLERRG